MDFGYTVECVRLTEVVTEFGKFGFYFNEDDFEVFYDFVDPQTGKKHKAGPVTPGSGDDAPSKAEFCKILERYRKIQTFDVFFSHFMTKVYKFKGDREDSIISRFCWPKPKASSITTSSIP